MVAEASLEVVNALGLHARAAAALVRETNRFACEVFFIRDGNEVNGKSIMGVLTLAAAQGTALQVRCEGADAEAAVTKIRELFEAGFGEE